MIGISSLLRGQRFACSLVVLIYSPFSLIMIALGFNVLKYRWIYTFQDIYCSAFKNFSHPCCRKYSLPNMDHSGQEIGATIQLPVTVKRTKQAQLPSGYNLFWSVFGYDRVYEKGKTKIYCAGSCSVTNLTVESGTIISKTKLENNQKHRMFRKRPQMLVKPSLPGRFSEFHFSEE